MHHAYTHYVGKDLAIPKVGLQKANLYNGLFCANIFNTEKRALSMKNSLRRNCAKLPDPRERNCFVAFKRINLAPRCTRTFVEPTFFLTSPRSLRAHDPPPLYVESGKIPLQSRPRKSVLLLPRPHIKGLGGRGAARSV